MTVSPSIKESGIQNLLSQTEVQETITRENTELQEDIAAYENTESQEDIAAYEYAGYQIRVHFTGEKTLAQCIKNLAEKRMIYGRETEGL